MHVREGEEGKVVCRSLVVLDQVVHHLPCPPLHVGDGGVWTNSQTGLLLFPPCPRSSEAARMVTRPDTVTGAGEQSLTRRALPSSRNTYCSLFLRAHTQTPQGNCHPPTLKAPKSPPHTHTHTHSPSHVWVITCFHYIFHAGGLLKLEWGYETGSREPNISTFIELSVTVRRSTHAPPEKKDKVHKTKLQTRADEAGREGGWGRLEEEVEGRERNEMEVVRGIATASWEYQHIHSTHPTMSTVCKIFDSTVIYVFEYRGGRVCSETMWRNATPLCNTHAVHRHKVTGQLRRLVLLPWKFLSFFKCAPVQACAHAVKGCVCVCVCVCVFARIQTHMQQTVLVSENWKKKKKKNASIALRQHV